MTTRTASTDIEGLVKRLEGVRLAIEVTDACLKLWNNGKGSPANIEAALATVDEAATALRDIDKARKGAVVAASSPAGGDVRDELERERDCLVSAQRHYSELEGDYRETRSRLTKVEGALGEIARIAHGHSERPLKDCAAIADAALSPSLPAKGDSFVASASVLAEPAKVQGGGYISADNGQGMGLPERCTSYRCGGEIVYAPTVSYSDNGDNICSKCGASYGSDE